jgi:sirohydrochlorin cobaltochelatase
VESETIYVVPVFISEGYFTQTVIPRELELEGPVTRRNGLKIHYCDPVGSHPRMTEALLRRAREVAPNVPPGTTSLFIVGHGTDLNDNSARAAKEQAARIRALGEYAEVISSYMEEPPLIADWHKISNQPHVVIVPFFIADGLHSYQDIPVLIGIEAEPGLAASQTDVFRRNPYLMHGKKLFYASAIGTEPMIAEVILDQVAASAASAH